MITLTQDQQKTVDDYLYARRRYYEKWQEEFENRGEKNISAVDKLMQNTEEADDLFIADLYIQLLKTALHGLCQQFYPDKSLDEIKKKLDEADE